LRIHYTYAAFVSRAAFPPARDYAVGLTRRKASSVFEVNSEFAAGRLRIGQLRQLLGGHV